MTCRRKKSRGWGQILPLWAVLLLSLTACGELSEPLDLQKDQPYRPEHFPTPVYDFGDNVYSDAGFELGEALFNDPILSLDSTISCQSCHQAENGFADGGKALSVGINGKLTTKHSPVVFNMAWNRSFMWDGGVTHLEIMPFAPLTNPREMGEDMKNLVKKLNAHAYYPDWFLTVFGRSPIDDQQLFWALAQYMANLVEADSRYDRYILGKGQFTAEEKQGLALFEEYCQTCHTPPLFTDYNFYNNGLELADGDIGRFRVTRDPADMGRFKVPTLRRIADSAPYMHDGRFATLREVLDHYSSGMADHPNLAPDFRRGEHLGLPLSEADKDNLIAFLQALGN